MPPLLPSRELRRSRGLDCFVFRGGPIKRGADDGVSRCKGAPTALIKASDFRPTRRFVLTRKSLSMQRPWCRSEDVRADRSDGNCPNLSVENALSSRSKNSLFQNGGVLCFLTNPMLEMSSNFYLNVEARFTSQNVYANNLRILRYTLLKRCAKSRC